MKRRGREKWEGRGETERKMEEGKGEEGKWKIMIEKIRKEEG